MSISPAFAPLRRARLRGVPAETPELAARLDSLWEKGLRLEEMSEEHTARAKAHRYPQPLAAWLKPCPVTKLSQIIRC